MPKSDPGVLIFTVDFATGSDENGLTPVGNLKRILEGLVGTFSRYQVPATWAVADPLEVMSSSRLLGSNPHHELALLGNSTSVGQPGGRRQFSRELSRRILQARAAGLDVSTLVPRENIAKQLLDLVVKYGVTAVIAPDERPQQRLRCAPTRKLRFGLWEVPVSHQFPSGNQAH